MMDIGFPEPVASDGIRQADTRRGGGHPGQFERRRPGLQRRFPGPGRGQSPNPGRERQGKEEYRKELALIAMAHRGAFVMQSSQATPSHLFKHLLRGLQVRRPAVFILNAPCPREWGIAQDSAPEAARLALESRAVPNIVFDPTAAQPFPSASTWRVIRRRRTAGAAVN